MRTVFITTPIILFLPWFLLRIKLVYKLYFYVLFPGCDTTCDFFGKGKAKRFSVLEKHPKFVEMFQNFGTEFDVHSLTKLKSLYVDSTIKQILTKSTKLVMRYSKLGNLTRIQCHVRWMFWKSIPSMHLEKSTQSNDLSSFHRRTWLDRWWWYCQAKVDELTFCPRKHFGKCQLWL